MTERTKGFITGLLTAALLIALSVTALAAAQTISVNGGVKLILDGTSFVPKDANGNAVDVFEYNGTTYVPVRAVSQAFGKEIAWDDTTRTVIIGSNNSSGSYNRQNPAPINTAQTVTVNEISYKYTVTMSLTEITRGGAAWAEIKAANMFNSAPGDGKEYILAKVKATVDSITTDRPVNFSEYDFDAYSAGNVKYPFESTVEPTPEFSSSVFAGGTLEGYVTFLVDKTDTAPKVCYGADYTGAGGIWFSLVTK
ncbi:MAG: stalk domain-containing protein [Clostridiaceae bacterium]|nr:stalk domain-containing protein [Clostridiaceae bacterium]